MCACACVHMGGGVSLNLKGPNFWCDQWEGETTALTSLLPSFQGTRVGDFLTHAEPPEPIEKGAANPTVPLYRSSQIPISLFPSLHLPCVFQGRFGSWLRSIMSKGD